MAEKRRRKQIRLRDYDYSSDGYYFVTICSHNREYLFGNYENVGAGLAPAQEETKGSDVGAGLASAPNQDEPVHNSIYLSKLGQILDPSYSRRNTNECTG